MMYGQTGVSTVMFPYFHTLLEPDDDFAKSNASPMGLTSGFLETSTMSDYNLGGEGDLFNAAEPMIGESSIDLDVAAAISMFSTGEDAICPQPLTASDIDTSLGNEQFLSEVFYECEKEPMAKGVNETVPTVKTTADDTFVADEKLGSDSPFGKSVSSDCLRSTDTVVESLETPRKPSFLDFPALDFETVYGMRRAFSEGDIKALGNGDIKLIHPPMGHHNFATMISCCSEDRKEKLSRYRSKRSRRNFSRKIKYACRKALADSQPRIRGRFAKTEGMESSFRKH